jgi:hypothetical protein
MAVSLWLLIVHLRAWLNCLSLFLAFLGLSRGILRSILGSILGSIGLFIFVRLWHLF